MFLCPPNLKPSISCPLPFNNIYYPGHQIFKIVSVYHSVQSFITISSPLHHSPHLLSPKLSERLLTINFIARLPDLSLILNIDKEYVNKKERERHLPDYCQ